MRSFRSIQLVSIAIVLCSVAFAQEAAPEKKPETPPEKKADAPREKDQGEPGPTAPPIKPALERQKALGQPQPGFGRDPMNDRRLAAFVRLRELMFEKVKLDADKRKKIDVMFDDYMAGLLNTRQLPHTQPRAEDVATPQELPELRKQLEAAEKAGDAEKIESTKAKIFSATIVLEPCVIDQPVFFFNYVNAELSEEQRKEFESVLNRWQLLRVAEVAPDNDFKQLRRSSRDPLLGRSEELGKQLDAMLIEAMRSSPFPQRNDQATMTDLAAKTKPKILEKLDPKQQVQLEKTLEMLEQWEKDDVVVVQKTRQRLKDHKPGRAGETPVTAPVQGSSAQP